MRLAFFIMMLFGILLIIPVALILTTGRIASWVQKGSSIAQQVYPQDLVMEISATSGVVTNSTGPVFIPLNSFGWNMGRMMMDEALSGKNDNDYRGRDMQGVENLLVIDTNATPTMIDEYKTAALLTKDSLVVKNNQHETRIFAIQDALQGSAEKVVLTSWSVQEKITSIGNTIVENKNSIVWTTYLLGFVFGLIFAIILSFFIGLFTALFLFLYAIVLRLLAKAMKKNYTYTESYSFAAAGFVLPFLFFAASWWFKAALLAFIVGRIWYLDGKKNGWETVAATVDAPASSGDAIDAEEQETMEVVADIIKDEPTDDVK